MLGTSARASSTWSRAPATCSHSQADSSRLQRAVPRRRAVDARRRAARDRRVVPYGTVPDERTAATCRSACIDVVGRVGRARAAVAAAARWSRSWCGCAWDRRCCSARATRTRRPAVRDDKFRTMTDRRDADGALLPDAERLTASGGSSAARASTSSPSCSTCCAGEMSLVGPAAAAHGVPAALLAGAGPPARGAPGHHRVDPGERPQRAHVGGEVRARRLVRRPPIDAPRRRDPRADGAAGGERARACRRPVTRPWSRSAGSRVDEPRSW